MGFLDLKTKIILKVDFLMTQGPFLQSKGTHSVLIIFPTYHVEHVFFSPFKS